MTPHPGTAKSYVAVIPRQAAAFSDIYSCYLEIAKTRDWLSVIPTSAFAEAFSESRGRDTTFIHWAPSHDALASIPRDRKALVLPVYSEALDDDASTMLPDHVRDWCRFSAIAPKVDGFFAHTPEMVTRISELTTKRGFVLPVGWDPVMGTPSWDEKKTRHDAVFAGSMVGRRQLLIPLVAKHLELDILTAVYGAKMHEILNHSKASLYVAHSDVRSYSTWRIWQCLCSSAALVTEKGDFWPLSESMCFPIEKLSELNVRDVCSVIKSISQREALDRARELHHGLRHFTTSFCFDNYVVEATSDLSR